MFRGCTSLTTAPALPATTLADCCYDGMFSGCTSLATAPALPAMTLADGCYQGMFQGCTSLTSLPELPATTLATNCYQRMFQDCTSLTTVPKLPATTLKSNCYGRMFLGCTGIKLSQTQTGEYSIPYRIPTSGTGTTGTNSLNEMFRYTGGTFTGTPSINTTYYLPLVFNDSYFYIEAVENTTITLSKVGSPTVGNAKYSIDLGTPIDYTYGSSITLTPGQKCYWYIESTNTNFSMSDYLKFTSTGKINAGGNLSSLIGGQTTIPRDYCFEFLFRGCTNLIDASAINFGSITDFNSKAGVFCYMFFGCTSLTAPPELPATTLTNYCYDSMFFGCTSLKISDTKTGKYRIPYRIPSAGTGTTTTNALYEMFAETGGTFTGTPTINTTYYLWDPNAFVYTITIPTEIDLNNTDNLGISYDIEGGQVEVSVTSENNWKMVKSTSQITYSLDNTNWILDEGVGTETIEITTTGIPTLVGNHTDSLTFTYGKYE